MTTALSTTAVASVATTADAVIPKKPAKSGRTMHVASTVKEAVFDFDDEREMEAMLAKLDNKSLVYKGRVLKEVKEFKAGERTPVDEAEVKQVLKWLEGADKFKAGDVYLLPSWLRRFNPQRYRLSEKIASDEKTKPEDKLREQAITGLEAAVGLDTKDGQPMALYFCLRKSVSRPITANLMILVAMNTEEDMKAIPPFVEDLNKPDKFGLYSMRSVYPHINLEIADGQTEERKIQYKMLNTNEKPRKEAEKPQVPSPREVPKTRPTGRQATKPRRTRKPRPAPRRRTDREERPAEKKRDVEPKEAKQEPANPTASGPAEFYV